MSNTTHFDQRSASFDEGIEHHHNWARERSTAQRPAPLVADAAYATTPSTTLHDDALYAFA